ncbi:hypothetical protein [Nocardia sp. NPDC050175]|uniref:hypothetical protein n=1 Tax=Nocardia sp. NPDC050175 TaxID=3364317 RepID=UPI0037BAC934
MPRIAEFAEHLARVDISFDAARGSGIVVGTDDAVTGAIEYVAIGRAEAEHLEQQLATRPKAPSSRTEALKGAFGRYRAEHSGRGTSTFTLDTAREYPFGSAGAGPRFGKIWTDLRSPRSKNVEFPA